MFTIFILLAGIMSGEFGLALLIVIFGWMIIISASKRNVKTHSIDKYMDENYGDINWLENHKL